MSAAAQAHYAELIEACPYLGEPSDIFAASNGVIKDVDPSLEVIIQLQRDKEFSGLRPAVDKILGNICTVAVGLSRPALAPDSKMPEPHYAKFSRIITTQLKPQKFKIGKITNIDAELVLRQELEETETKNSIDTLFGERASIHMFPTTEIAFILSGEIHSGSSGKYLGSVGCAGVLFGATTLGRGGKETPALHVRARSLRSTDRLEKLNYGRSVATARSVEAGNRTNPFGAHKIEAGSWRFSEQSNQGGVR